MSLYVCHAIHVGEHFWSVKFSSNYLLLNTDFTARVGEWHNMNYTLLSTDCTA